MAPDRVKGVGRCTGQQQCLDIRAKYNLPFRTAGCHNVLDAILAIVQSEIGAHLAAPCFDILNNVSLA